MNWIGRCKVASCFRTMVWPQFRVLPVALADPEGSRPGPELPVILGVTSEVISGEGELKIHFVLSFLPFQFLLRAIYNRLWISMQSRDIFICFSRAWYQVLISDPQSTCVLHSLNLLCLFSSFIFPMSPDTKNSNKKAAEKWKRYLASPQNRRTCKSKVNEICKERYIGHIPRLGEGGWVLN